MLRDRRGRIIYVGRSRDLSSRVRSYWVDLGDRPRLLRMVKCVECGDEGTEERGYYARQVTIMATQGQLGKMCH